MVHSDLLQKRERCFKRNLEILAARGLAHADIDQLRNEAGTPAHQEISISIGPQETPFACLVRNGKAWACEASEGPLEQARALARAAVLRDQNALYVWIGFGFGYGCEALLQEMGPRSRLLAIEPLPAVFRAAMESRDLRKIFRDGRFQILLGTPGERLEPSLDRLIGQNDFTAMRPVMSPSYVALLGDEGHAWAHAASLHFRSRILDFTTLRISGPKMVRQQLQNLKWGFKQPGLEGLKGIPGMPAALVVGAGPSLDHALPFVRHMVERVPVIAVDAAMPALRKAAIDPHLVVSLDGHESIFDFAKRLDPERTGCLVDLSVSPRFASLEAAFRLVSIPRHWSALLALSAGREAWEEQMGFVGGCAVLAARKLGARHIYLTGMDFAFSKEGAVYAQGTLDPEHMHSDAEGELVSVPGYVTARLPTRIQYLCHLKRFLEFIREHPDPAYTVVSKDGARMAEAPRLDPLEAVARLDGWPVRDWRIPLKEHVAAAAAHMEKTDQGMVLAALVRRFNGLRARLEELKQPKEVQRILFAPEYVHIFNALGMAYLEVMEALIRNKGLDAQSVMVLRERMEMLAPHVRALIE